jgi:RNA recognition motif-containing protein
VISKRSFGTTTTLRRQARGGNNNNSSSCSLAQSFFLAGGGGDDDDQGGGSKHKAYYYHSSGTRNGISCRPTATRRYSKLTRRQDDNDSDDDGDGSPGNNNGTLPAEAFHFEEVRVHPVSPFGIDWLTRVWTPPSRNADHPAVIAAAAALELNVLQWKNSSSTLEPLPLTSDDSLRQHYQHHQHHHRETTLVAVAAKASETASETTTTMEMTSSSQSSPLGGFDLVDWDAQRTTETAIGVADEPATVLGEAAAIPAPTIQQQQLAVGGGEMMKMGSTKFANKPQASGNIVWNEIYEDEETLYGGEEEGIVEKAHLLAETTAKVENAEAGSSTETSGEEAEDGTTADTNVSISLKDRNGTRVYVNHLSWKVVCQDLHEHMQSTGLEVKNASVLRDDVGRTKRAGIVTFHNAMDAQKAVEQLNKTELRGRKIMVREYYEDREALHASRDTAVTRASLVMVDGATVASLNTAATNDKNNVAAAENVNNKNDDVGLLSEKAEPAASSAMNDIHQNKREQAMEESSSTTDLLPVAIPESDRVFVASASKPEAKDNNGKRTAATFDNNNDTNATNSTKAIPWWASRKKLLAAELNKAL